MDRVSACFELAAQTAEILSAMRGKTRTTFKGEADPVTEADHAAEAFLLKELLGRFPGDGFLGEEGAKEQSRTGFLWIADPLDGTVNYAHGLPHFCVSLALLKDDEVLAGCVVQAATLESFQSEKGSGAYRGGKRLYVSETRELGFALASTDFPYERAARLGRGVRRVEALLQRCQSVRILGSCALELCRVAAGELDLYAIEGTKAWDVAAGSLILQEAGGSISNWEGKKLDLLEPSRMLASNGLLHDALVETAEAFS